jgi:cation-dependent mannose-6-phosphate receptor
MRLLALLLFSAMAAAAVSPADAGTDTDEDELAPSSTVPVPACTATSSTGTGAFFDLRPDMAVEVEDGKTAHRGQVVKDYFARGHDYGSNFTLNVCGSVVKPVLDVVGINNTMAANVSAYYTNAHGKTFSLGYESKNLTTRGRKLVLQYVDGSPCGHDDRGRKSTTISFLCDRDPTTSQATFSFIGTDPDECAYFFEARSFHACAHAEPHKPGSVGPGSIFGLIVMIAILVYVLGGVFYNRTVAHARGWRQLPNYSLWAGIFNFVCVRPFRRKPPSPLSFY